MTKRREVGFGGAENPPQVPARDFGEQRIGANVVRLGLGEQKKLPNVVRLVSWVQKNTPNVVGVIFRKQKSGFEVVGGVFMRPGGGANDAMAIPLIARLRGCAVARLRGCAVAPDTSPIKNSVIRREKNFAGRGGRRSSFI